MVHISPKVDLMVRYLKILVIQKKIKIKLTVSGDGTTGIDAARVGQPYWSGLFRPTIQSLFFLKD